MNVIELVLDCKENIDRAVYYSVNYESDSFEKMIFSINLLIMNNTSSVDIDILNTIYDLINKIKYDFNNGGPKLFIYSKEIGYIEKEINKINDEKISREINDIIDSFGFNVIFETIIKNLRKEIKTIKFLKFLYKNNKLKDEDVEIKIEIIEKFIRLIFEIDVYDKNISLSETRDIILIKDLI